MKTALIFTGGTIGSRIGSGGLIAPDAGKGALIGGYDTEAFDIFEPYSILSENLNADYLTRLLKCIEKNMPNHNGIIVMHGTDTLQYSASAAAYAFGLNTIPIMFVSSNYILSDSRANGKINFRCALDFIKNDSGRGVFISYKNAGEAPKIHRAARVLAYAQYSDKITSLGGEYGHYEKGIFIKNADYSELPDETEPFGAIDLSRARAARLPAYPDMTIPPETEAVLLETYHSGTVCEDIITGTDKKIFALGVEKRIQYESTRVYDRENVTVLKKAAAPAMYIKLRAALCAGRLNDMNKSLGGDFIE